MAEPTPRTLTHQDLARRVGVSVTTIKSYRRKFPEFFQPPTLTKPLRFVPDTEKLCRTIFDLFQEGLSIKQARRELAKVFPIVADIDSLPITHDSTQGSAESTGDFERLFHVLGQMSKGMGAMATAQAKFGLEAAKDKDRIDTLFAQQNALVAHLNEISANLNKALAGLAQQAGKSPAAAPRRVINVRGEQGAVHAYEFTDRPPESGTAGPEPRKPGEEPARSRAEEPTGSFQTPGPESGPTPSSQSGPTPGPTPGPPVGPKPGPRDVVGRPDFLDLPAVMHSARGEYLGLTGPSGRPFSLGELEAYLGQRPDLKPLDEAWQGADEEWTLTLQSPHSTRGRHAFSFRKTQTPKGNHVALLRQLSIDGTTVTEGFLQAFFRQIRESLLH